MSKVVGIFKYFNSSRKNYLNNLLAELLISGIQREEIFILSEDFCFNKKINQKHSYSEKKIYSNSYSSINKNLNELDNKIEYVYNPKYNNYDNEFLSLMIKGSIFGGLFGLIISIIILMITPNVFQLLLSESAITIFSCFISCISLGIIIGMISSLFKNEKKINNNIITIVYTNKGNEKLVKDIFKKYYSYNIQIYH